MMKTTLFCCKIFVTARSKLFIAVDLNLAILKNVYCSQSLVLQSVNRRGPFLRGDMAHFSSAATQ